MTIKRRFGKFYIPFTMSAENIIYVQTIVRRMSHIVQVKQINDIEMTEHIAQSELFEEISRDTDIPEYIMSIGGDGEIKAIKGEIVKKKFHIHKDGKSHTH